jgi:hypothetical protein
LEAIISKSNDTNKIVTMSEAIFESSKITATVDGNHLEKRFKIVVKGTNGEKMWEPIYLDTGEGC